MFIRGLPGAGKTTLAKHIEAFFDVVRLDPDEIKLSGLILKGERLKTVKYRQLLKTCVASINSGNSVVWSQPWRKPENIKLTADNIVALSKNPIKPPHFLVVEIDIDKQTSWKRSRNKFSSKSNFDNYISRHSNCDLEIQFLKINGNLTQKAVSILCDKFIIRSTQDKQIK